MRPENDSLRIALLTYRGHQHSGGQGVYVRYLSRALTELGHRIEVFAGQPFPVLDEGIAFTPLPSLDLYRPEDPFRRPARDEFRDWIDLLEYGLMCTAAFPEPLSFSLRVARELRSRVHDFDIVHDNQCLGYGLLEVAKRMPTVATVHHPISLDRQVDLHKAATKGRRAALKRWYGFTRMQSRVARRLPKLLTVSDSARGDVVREFKADPRSVSVVHNGVDAELFCPLPRIRRVPGRVITVASADLPIKGLSFLIEAIAKLKTERDVELVVVGKGGMSRGPRELAHRYGIGDAVRFEGRVDSLRLVELYAEAQVAVVPSLYEGFSLPAIEAMSCGVPLVTTTGGALPEVVGPDGEAGWLVPPGDASALASAIGSMLDEDTLRERLGRAGRRRTLSRFTWNASASQTAALYREVQASC
ncbi:MAG: glycosyltransferase family 4 protein [Actinomycetota bacterium]|nr:glycosyltransferase family 4 protein [Actinomycetota bacterium]